MYFAWGLGPTKEKMSCVCVAWDLCPTKEKMRCVCFAWGLCFTREKMRCVCVFCLVSMPYKGKKRCVRVCVLLGVYALQRGKRGVFSLGSTPYKGEDGVCMCVFCVGSTPYH